MTEPVATVGVGRVSWEQCAIRELREAIGDRVSLERISGTKASVDLIYADPPFNSNRDYNVIFRDESGDRSDAQLLAFEDTWHWGPSAESTYRYLTNTAHHEGRVPDKVN